MNKNKRIFIAFILLITMIILIAKGGVAIYKNRTAELIFRDAVVDISDDSVDEEEAVQILKKHIVEIMPNCRITRLYVDNIYSEYIIQNFINEGKQILLLKMDFYVSEDEESPSYDVGNENFGFSWLFIRDNADSPWDLESYGYVL